MFSWNMVYKRCHDDRICGIKTVFLHHRCLVMLSQKFPMSDMSSFIGLDFSWVAVCCF